MVAIAKQQDRLEQLGLATLAHVKKFKGELAKNHRSRRDVFNIAGVDSSDKTLVLFLKRNWKSYKKIYRPRCFRMPKSGCTTAD